MKKSNIIKEIEKSITLKNNIKVKVLVNYLFELIKTNLKNHNAVEIRGFGRFSLKKRKGYEMKNPKTKKMYNIPSHHIVYFKSGKVLSDFINFPKSKYNKDLENF